MLSISMQTPYQVDAECWWCWLLLSSPPTYQKNARKLVTPSLSHHYKTSHYTLQAGTHSSEGTSLLWPSLPGKEIKLFFATSAKTLSPRFNSVLIQRLDLSSNWHPMWGQLGDGPRSFLWLDQTLQDFLQASISWEWSIEEFLWRPDCLKPLPRKAKPWSYLVLLVGTPRWEWAAAKATFALKTLPYSSFPSHSELSTPWNSI